MMQEQERAGRWVAVSTKRQDEESQEPDIAQWVKDHDYELVATYRLHGVSRYTGKKRHDEMLDRVIEDMTRGKIQVLVVWQSSRIERRGAYNAFDLARRVKAAGGRIEYVQDTYLNDTNDMSDVMLALAATKDKQESKDKSKRISNELKLRRERGLWLGGTPPYGYIAICTCHKRHDCPYRASVKQRPEGWKLVIDPEKQTILDDDIADKIIAGRSALSIVRWLNNEGIPTQRGGKWSTTVLLKMLRSPALLGYRTHQPNWRSANENKGDRGKIDVLRDDDGMPVQCYDSLITKEKYDKLQAQLERNSVKNRTKAGYGQFGPIGSRYDAALLTGVARCFCGAPLTQGASRANSTVTRAAYESKFYRCHGASNPGQKTAHGRVNMAKLDAAVDKWITSHDYKLYEYELAIDENAEKLLQLESQIQSLMAASDYAQVAVKSQEAAELAKLHPKPKRMVPVPTGKRLADEWGRKGGEYETVEQKNKFLKDNGFQVLVGRKVRMFGGIHDTSGDWQTDKYGRVLCDGCGNLAQEKFGTCCIHTSDESMLAKPECRNLLQRRRYANNQARRAGKPEPYKTLDPDEIWVVVIPGLKYEADYYGQYELYEQDPRLAHDKIHEIIMSQSHGEGADNVMGQMGFNGVDKVTGRYDLTEFLLAIPRPPENE